MGGLRQYTIPFKGLKEGKHDFNFVVDNSFFEQFESSEVKRGVVNVQVELIKHSQFLELQFDINGKITVNCDRCLEPFVSGITHQTMLYIRFGEKTTAVGPSGTTMATNARRVTSCTPSVMASGPNGAPAE